MFVKYCAAYILSQHFTEPVLRSGLLQCEHLLRMLNSPSLAAELARQPVRKYMLQASADCADAFFCRLLCRLPCLRDVWTEQYPGRGKGVVQCWHQRRHVQHRVLLARQDVVT